MTITALAFVGIRIWVIVGALIALGFLAVGLDRVDEDARGSYIFRLLLIPGIIMIWPIVVWRWIILEKTQSQIGLESFHPPRKAHGGFAVVLGVAVFVIIAIALYIRQPIPNDYKPQKLSFVVEKVVG